MAVFLSTHLEVAVTATSLFFVSLSFFFLYILARNRHSPIIKAHSFTFTAFSLVGSLLTYLAPFTWPLDSPSVLCGVRPWAFTLPLYVLLCPLLAKHYRIHRIFNMQSLTAQRWGVSDSHVLLLSLALLLPQVVINIVWTVVHPLAPIDITHTNGTLLLRDCHASAASAAFAWASVAYIGVLLCSAVYLTIRLRHLADEFNQSKDILSCTLLIFGAAVVIIALQVTEQTDYSIRYAIRSFGLFLILLTWQLVIMVPKMLAIRRATSVAYTADERHKGPQRLPLTPHVIKQIAAYNSLPTHAMNKPKLAAGGAGGGAAAAGGAAGGDKDTMSGVMFSANAIKQAKPSNYPALSTLMTFMSPAAADDKANSTDAAGTGAGQQIELVIDPIHGKQQQQSSTAAPARHLQAGELDINKLNRISVSSAANPQQQQHETPSPSPSPSPFQSDLQTANNSGSDLPAPSPSASTASDSRTNRSSPKTHLRSKSHSPFMSVAAAGAGNSRSRIGGDGNGKLLSSAAVSGSGGLTDGRLPSLKQLRMGLLVGSGTVDSVSYTQSVGTGKGTVKGGRGGGKDVGGVGLSQFKTNF